MEHIYQHFRKEEKPFIDQAQKWLEQAEAYYSPVLTPFLDPRQRYIVQTIYQTLYSEDLRLSYWGGYERAERQMALIYPDYYQPQADDWGLVYFRINYPQKFAHLDHRQILGTLMSLGLKREYIGDIITDGSDWQCMVYETMANFIRQEVSKIANIHVRLEPIEQADVLEPLDEWQSLEATVSSYRLDQVIATVFNLSRQRAKTMIQAGLVKLNWQTVNRSDLTIEVGDMVSVRRFGRLQYLEPIGRTRKHNYRMRCRVKLS